MHENWWFQKDEEDELSEYDILEKRVKMLEEMIGFRLAKSVGHNPNIVRLILDCPLKDYKGGFISPDKAEELVDWYHNLLPYIYWLRERHER